MDDKRTVLIETRSPSPSFFAVQTGHFPAGLITSTSPPLRPAVFIGTVLKHSCTASTGSLFTPAVFSLLRLGPAGTASSGVLGLNLFTSVKCVLPVRSEINNMEFNSFYKKRGEDSVSRSVATRRCSNRDSPTLVSDEVAHTIEFNEPSDFPLTKISSSLSSAFSTILNPVLFLGDSPAFLGGGAPIDSRRRCPLQFSAMKSSPFATLSRFVSLARGDALKSFSRFFHPTTFHNDIYGPGSSPFERKWRDSFRGYDFISQIGRQAGESG
ncbi:hypothetical protein KSP40_PGU017365 [Platanthera guangdongensis]|uniref:Uncharacterized protein n=1 Tax=Platanthera guangdongensis TaxID=2320717 RepID=A0ABR2N113_9ASPA